MEVPVIESGEAFGIDVRAQTLENGFVHDLSPLVNRDLDDFIPRCGG
jgi:hypothetical protein